MVASIDSSSANGSIDIINSPASSSTEPEPEIGREETKTVRKIRIFIIFVLIASGISVSLAFYLATRNGEHTNFVATFNSTAKTILQSFAEGIVEKNIKSLVTFSGSVTSMALITRSVWPFVTIPDFTEISEDLMDLTHARQITFSPVLRSEQLDAWANYTTTESVWFQEAKNFQQSHTFERNGSIPDLVDLESEQWIDSSSGFSDRLFIVNPRTNEILKSEAPNSQHVPLWQVLPVAPSSTINQDILLHAEFGFGVRACLSTEKIVLGGFETAEPGGLDSENLDTQHFAFMVSYQAKEVLPYTGGPLSSIYVPVFDSFDKETRKLVGIVSSTIMWADFFENLLTSEVTATVVVRNSCEGSISFKVVGPKVTLLGFGDYHEEAYNHMVRSLSFESLLYGNGGRIGVGDAWCAYSLDVYPTREFERELTTRMPATISSAVAVIFLFSISIFVIYNHVVERRQHSVKASAEMSGAIVSSMFPKNVQMRLMEDRKTQKCSSNSSRLRQFLQGEDPLDEDEIDSSPIADMYPHATVLFADIAGTPLTSAVIETNSCPFFKGFTSWSSSREPGHVFVLLQTVYQAFDACARQHRVFKVETIGDCYVAATGLPNPQDNHAILMVRFAAECRSRFLRLTKKLEKVLGPDTNELGLRLGIHSGPVTAGVLRGDRARFQLFGDTVNTASRMESTSETNKIQVSQSTAHLLIAAEKGHWLTPRDSEIFAKGKGTMETFWVIKRSVEVSSSTNDDDSAATSISGNSPDSERRERIIDWMTNLVLERLQKVLAHRKALGGEVVADGAQLVYFNPKNRTSLEEVVETITLPKFKAEMAKSMGPGEVEVPVEVEEQLRCFLHLMADTYRSNPFHNFEHAAHVTMVVDKFLKRIVNVDVESDNAAERHDYTHGINNDPIAMLAIVLSAVVHDSDHRGVSNMQLAKEDEQMAEIYKNKSIAEQNSLDIAWNILMESRFDQLRLCMFGNKDDMHRFRQVFVNVVLATDIFDKELNDLRWTRWRKAFDETGNEVENFSDLRATIVIEHIIQAADVSHTMQHWHVYRKWNQRLFTEMFLAYKSGRMAKDPSTFWYKGELGFFDNYIIPLAEKLKECNVFGVSSYECLNYATQNRAEWRVKGEGIVAQMVSNLSEEPVLETNSDTIAE